MNFLSALAFYLATFFVHAGIYQQSQEPISQGVLHAFVSFSPIFYVFFRQILGLFVFTPFFLKELRSSGLGRPKPWVILRAFSNLAALLAFYQAVALSGAAHSNVLNMTYPAFVFVFAYFILKERPELGKIILLGLCLSGAFLQLLPGRSSAWELSEGSLWGLASGALAGLSIVSLRRAARDTHPSIILFWLFLLGTLVSFPLCYQELKLLNLENSIYILLSALCGVSAQWFLTLSYAKLEAVTGSLISTVRIPLALLIGILFLGENFSWNEYLGAAIIFTCNILLALRLQASYKEAWRTDTSPT